MSSPAPRAVTPEMIISSSKKEKAAAAEQGAFRGRRSGKGKDGNNDSSSGGKPSKRRKTNNQQGMIDEFDQEFGDVESLFLSGNSTRRRQQEPSIDISKVRRGIDSLFLPYHAARRLRIPEVLWIYHNPEFDDCPFNIPDHEEEEEKEYLPKAIWRDVPYEVTERVRQGEGQ